MAGFLDIEVLGAQRVYEDISRGMLVINHMKPILDEIADNMMEVIGATFRSQGRRGGGSWHFLSEPWLKYKIEHGLDPRILFAHGWLEKSMTERDDEDQVLEVTDEFIKLDSSLPYANVQQEGGGPKGLPARPYVKFTERDVERWVHICEVRIYEAMGTMNMSTKEL